MDKFKFLTDLKNAVESGRNNSDSVKLINDIYQTSRTYDENMVGRMSDKVNRFSDDISDENNVEYDSNSDDALELDIKNILNDLILMESRLNEIKSLDNQYEYVANDLKIYLVDYANSVREKYVQLIDTDQFSILKNKINDIINNYK